MTPNSWANQPTYGFDIESTGVDVHTDRIVTATIVKLVDGAPTTHRSWLLDPGIEIPEAATNVHGITTQHATEHGMPALEGVALIADTITAILRARCPLVVFNAAYDLSLLEVECRRHNLPTLVDQLEPHQWHTIIDPMVLAKGMDTIRDRKFVKGRKFTLPQLCEWYKVPFTETHDAQADATGAALLALALAAKDDHIANLPPAPLHQLQTTWRREMQRSLRDYFDKVGKDHDGVDGGWPIHTQLQTRTTP